ncbi:MAG: hypothetical protein ACR2RB_20880 [Gammaproteobacteria bacterium]
MDNPRLKHALLALAVAMWTLLPGIHFALLGLDPDRNLPPKSELNTAEGELQSVLERRRCLTIRVRGDTAHDYRYCAQGGGLAALRDALAGSDGRVQIRLDYSPHRTFDLFTVNRTLHRVFEVEVNGQVVRPYDEVANAWRENNRHLGLWFATPMIVVGLFFLVGAGAIACGFAKRA